VTGGAFVRPTVEANDGRPTAVTFGGDTESPGREAFDLAVFADVLERGRVFVRTAVDQRGVGPRHQLASLGRRASAHDREAQSMLAEARAHGHDLLLVVQSLNDGPVESRGINGQWPVTLAVWLLLGLGVVIPDHTYESRASLQIVLRDLETGAEIDSIALGGGPIDLALIDRTDVWGLLTSIIIPPFWVGDDPERVVRRVREASTERLLVTAAQRLKSVDVLERIRAATPADIGLRRTGEGMRVEVSAREALSFARLRAEPGGVDPAALERFSDELLASLDRGAGGLRYSALLPAAAASERVQVLVQTVAGRVASVTFALRELQ
jgi:hypothetical protein